MCSATLTRPCTGCCLIQALRMRSLSMWWSALYVHPSGGLTPENNLDLASLASVLRFVLSGLPAIGLPFSVEVHFHPMSFGNFHGPTGLLALVN
jgi:hypothetical protein